MQGMKINELAEEYGRSADRLKERIGTLEHCMKETEDEEKKLVLDHRLRPLRAMYRETRLVARHLEHYYARTGETKRRIKGK